MNAPKILPWIARKAGIDDTLALKLWRRAAGESEQLCGNCQSAEYYAATLSRFMDLVEEESGMSFSEPAGERSGWFWRQQKRMSQLNWQAAQNLTRQWKANFGNFLNSQRTTA